MARVTIQGKLAKIAERTKVKAAIGIDGPSGDGKSGLALILARGLISSENEKKIYTIDTENKSLLLYVQKLMSDGKKMESFWHAELTKNDGYSPFNYEYLREDAKSKNCEVIIQDSYTHCWLRKGGVLDMVNTLQTDPKFNKYTAWGHPDVAEAKNLIFELIRDDELHVISTIRVKEAFAMQTGDNGKAQVVSLGEQEMQIDGLKYEFDLLLSMLEPGNEKGKPPRVLVEKSRYELFQKGEIYDITPELINKLKEYLETGISIEELNEKTRIELAQYISEKANNDKSLKTIFINDYPGKKAIDLTLEQLREINAKFISVEYA